MEVHCQAGVFEQPKNGLEMRHVGINRFREEYYVV